MKRMLLFAVAAVATATVASAALPQQYQPRRMQPVSDNLKIAESVELNQSIAGKAADFKFGNLRSFDSGTHTIGCVYQMPAGSFYGALLPYQGKNYYTWVTLLPTGTPLTFNSILVAYPNDANTPAFDDWDNIARKWDYYSGYTFYKDDFTAHESTANSISLVAPCDVDVMLYDSPMLSIDYYNMADTFQLYAIVPGGKPFSVYPDGTGIAEIQAMSLPVVPFTNLGYCPSTYYGSAVATTIDGEDITWSEYSNRVANKPQLAEAFRKQFGDSLVKTEIVGYYNTLGYAGAPYALSTMEMGFNYVSAKGGELTVNLVRIEDSQPTDEILYTTTVKVPASANEATYTLEVPFSSVNEYDEELSYIMIDCPVFVEVYGLDNFEVFAPHAVGYDATRVEAYSVADAGGVLLNLYGENPANNLPAVVTPISHWTWTTDAGEATKYKGLYFRFDVEYPTLVASRYQINGTETHFGDRANDSYAVDLAEGEEQISVVLATSAEYADELYIDDSTLPAWLTLDSVEDYYQAYPQQGGLQRGAVLNFSTDGTYEKRTSEMTVEYKGKTITLYIGQGGAAEETGINNVTAAGNGAAEYFDIQGRKLMAAPANGFFLQRQGNKVTKVIR